MKKCFLICAAATQLHAASLAASPSPTELDLLIVYTSAVASNYDGASGVEAHAMASTGSVNDALQNSEIPVVFNLVAVEQIDYTESNTSLNADLRAIAGKPDGGDPVDPAHAEVLDLRDRYGADLVTLFRDGPASGTAGLAYLLDPANDAEDFAYAVVSDASALSNLTLAHELGHNMASAHGRGEAGEDPDIDEARGYSFSANGSDVRTIMSIDSNFSRISHFSNPDVLYEGVPTGLPVGDPNAADNASAFAVSTPVIAAFRRTQTEAPSVLEEAVGDTIVDGGGTQLRALLRGRPPLTVDWFEGEVGDTSNPLPSTEVDLERGGTESVVELSGINQTTAYWLRVTNPNDTLETRAVKVVVVPAPSTSAQLVEQAQRDGGFNLSRAFEQEMTVPEAAYIGAIKLVLAKIGDPPNPTVRFEEIGGPLIFEQELDASQVADWDAQSPQALPVEYFAEPGSQFRVTLTPHPDQDESNKILWHFANTTEDPNVGDSNLGGNPRLMFTLQGTNAWTYHTWLETTQPPTTSTGLQPGDEIDGLPNLVRYALGGDFSTPSAALRPQLQPLASTPGGPEAVLRFTRRPDLADVAFTVEQSADLEAWAPVDASAIQTLAPTPEGDAAFEVRLPYGEAPLFLRLRAER